MSCIMKYRKKDSNNEWQYYEDTDARHCTDYLIMNEYEDDYEYEIYEFSKDGYVNGIRYEDDVESLETKLDYLFNKYECNDIDTLKARCPINLNLLNLESEATEEFKYKRRKSSKSLA